ncbi:hypothetical protein [Plantactinospora sp. KBS50]|uniref:hypothetical protein n=1 Tax=Plantactinospora sp. KBS50 TaxID=2024580 RepID=UPI000BAAC5DD|nr:hypothetical protein [Plantactinospora sp. KBS50]ASW53677.1 hypothetical protein CIK06_04940 [Plantactinospora sp. KBS50]
MITAVGDRLRSAWHAAGRITGTPLLVRAGVFLSMLLALALAVPAEFLAARQFGLMAALALLPAIGPRRTWTTVVTLVAVGAWLFFSTASDLPIEPWRLLGLAGALYLAHALSGLAALLPYDAVVDPSVPARWFGRAAAVVLVGAVAGLGLLAVAGLPVPRGGLLATVAGAAVAAGLAALLRWLVHRR